MPPEAIARLISASSAFAMSSALGRTGSFRVVSSPRESSQALTLA